MNGINLSNIRGLFFGGNTYTKMYYGATLIWPIDYGQQYFTTIARESGDIVFDIPSGVTAYCLRSISYSTDNGSTWTTINNVNNQAVTVTVPVNNGDKVLWKGAANSFYELGNQATFSNTTISFDVQGNIMSLLYGDNFYNYREFLEGVEYVFANLFSGTDVVDASNLIFADNLRPYCYAGMFEGCTSLTTAPELPATTLAEGCYAYMFLGCWNINYIKMLATDISATDCLNDWVNNVAATGTFVKYANTTIPIGNSGIPTGWTVINIDNYEYQYLTTVAKGSGNIEFNIPAGIPTNYLTSISYSTDNGNTWTTTNNVYSQAVTVTVPVNNGDKILWKGVGTQMWDSHNNAYFTSTVSFDIEGNIMSLLNGDNFYHSSFASGSSHNFHDLFRGANVVDASNLILPATTLTSACYYNMFYNCTSLTTAPELPAETLANNCYYYMFFKCTSLTTAPALPATTLMTDCYHSMFWGCTSLTTAPALPATTLAEYCYYCMFRGCTALATAPELPATILVRSCYSQMFYGCRNLNYIKMLATDISADGALSQWVYNVAATGTFVKDANATIPTGDSGIPSGWTVQNQ